MSATSSQESSILPPFLEGMEGRKTQFLPLSTQKVENGNGNFKRHEWPYLEQGTKADILALNKLRGIGEGGIHLTIERGFLYFFTLPQANLRAWCITDSTRYVRQDRMLDGTQFILKNGQGVKNRTLGSANWPIGVDEAAEKSTILLVEGMPDFVAAHHLIYCESREHDTAVVGMLGASMNIPDSVVEKFRGKRIRIFPHADGIGGPGIKAALRWRKKLIAVASRVDLADYQGLQTLDGRKVKDVNDFLGVDYDAWENDEKVRNAIP